MTEQLLSDERWHVTYYEREYHVRPTDNGDCIAHTQSKQYAEQIVAEHDELLRLRAGRVAAMTELTEMRNTRALDKNAWRRIGETMGLTEEESVHTSHVIATLAVVVAERDRLRARLEPFERGDYIAAHEEVARLRG